MENFRYNITYRLNGCDKFEEVLAKTVKEAKELYSMVGEEADFKVLYDIVSGEEIEVS